MIEPKLIASGNLLFKGSTENVMEDCVMPGLIRDLKKQLIYLCPDHKDTYVLEWRIRRGPLMGQE